MSVLDSAINLASGGALGGAFGLVGTYLTHRNERLEAAATRTHELAQAEVDMKVLRYEVEGRERIATIEAETVQTQAIVQAEAQTRAASYQIDQSTYGQGKSWLGRWGLDVVDIIRGLMRPGATAYLLWLMTMMWVETQSSLLALDEALDIGELITLQAEIGATALFLATSATTWWFGTRMMRRGK